MEKVMLGDILEYIQPAKYIVKNEQYKDSYKMPVLTAGKTFILGYTNETEGIYMATKEQPIILFDDFTTDCRYIDFNFKVKSSAVKILKLKNQNNNLKYLYYLLKNIVYDTSSHKRYWISQYSKFIINLPEIDIQNKIAKELEQIENLVNNKEKQIIKFDELIKSKFAEMFKNNSKVKLSDIANIVMGQSPDSKSYNNKEDGLPFFQGKADFGEKYTIVRQWTNNPLKIAKKGDVLMSVRAPVGPVNISSCDCCIGRGLCSISAKEGITNNEFLYNALNAIQDEFTIMGSGSTFKAINKNDVHNLKLPHATIELQNEFAKFVNQIDKQKKVCNKEITRLNELKQSKNQEYFGGIRNE